MKFHPVYLFLAVPYAAFLWVPFYNRLEPQFLGIPFFYWWQIFGIVLTSLVSVFVFRFTLDAAALIGIALIVSGVVVMNVFSNSVAH